MSESNPKSQNTPSHELERAESSEATHALVAEDGGGDMELAHPVARRKDERSMRTSLLFALIALTVPAAYYHGTLLQRWGDHADLTRYVDSLNRLPKEIGVWHHHSDGKPIAEHLKKQLEIRGFAHRVYENQSTGQHVSLLLLVGPAGPLVRHPPEICYQTRANRLLRSRPLNVNTSDGTAMMRLLSYESSSSIDGDFFVSYAFGCRGVWDVPKSPRLAYGGEPVLYKLHVLTDMASEASAESPEGMVNFIELLLPEVSNLVPST